MAMMIPPYIHKDIKSDAEKKIFNLIESDSLLKNWICFHSLGLAKHQIKRYGEIDFVLLGGWGILCLEVKGGGVKREKGLWTFTDRHGRENTKREGPFQQVSQAMFSLKTDLSAKFGKEINVLRFGYGVVLPDVRFKIDSPEWEKELIYDVADRSRPFNEYIANLQEYWINKTKSTKLSLKPDIIEDINNYIRGDFEITVPLWKKLEDTEEQIIRLTEDQYKALDRMAANQRVLFSGSAGTGKTLLALKQAKRMAAQGNKVLLLCFNSLLGKRIEFEFAVISGSSLITARTVHKYFRETIENGIFFEEFKREIIGKESRVVFNEIYPKYFIKSIENMNHVKYDCLIIDEGQDFLLEEIFKALGAILKKGLEHGQLYIFYDSNNQGELYHNCDCKFISKIKNSGTADYRLDVNCRNTKPIAIQTAVMSGFTMAESLIDHGEKVRYLWYHDLEHEKVLISGSLKKLLQEGVKPNEITILYPGGYEDVRGSLLTMNLNRSIAELTTENINTQDSRTLYISSIQAYKGLENKVIIIAGINKIGGSWINTLNYVGMSRAKELLYLSLEEKIRKDYEEKIVKFIDKS